MKLLYSALVWLRKQTRNWRGLHRYCTEVVYADLIRRGKLRAVLSIGESVDFIVNNRASVGRFGDGEFRLARNPRHNLHIGRHNTLRYQSGGRALTLSLREVLYADLPGFHPAILSATNKNHLANNYKLLMKLATPPVLNAEFPRADLRQVQRIWRDRKVVFISNAAAYSQAKTRGVFVGASEVEFLPAPAREAFARIDELLQAATKFNKEYLMILSLGPAATVLSYDLHRAGYQAVDIGSITSGGYQTD